MTSNVTNSDVKAAMVSVDFSTKTTIIAIGTLLILITLIFIVFGILLVIKKSNCLRGATTRKLNGAYNSEVINNSALLNFSKKLRAVEADLDEVESNRRRNIEYCQTPEGQRMLDKESESETHYEPIGAAITERSFEKQENKPLLSNSSMPQENHNRENSAEEQNNTSNDGNSWAQRNTSFKMGTAADRQNKGQVPTQKAHPVRPQNTSPYEVVNITRNASTADSETSNDVFQPVRVTPVHLDKLPEDKCKSPTYVITSRKSSDRESVPEATVKPIQNGGQEKQPAEPNSQCDLHYDIPRINPKPVSIVYVRNNSLIEDVPGQNDGTIYLPKLETPAKPVRQIPPWERCSNPNTPAAAPESDANKVSKVKIQANKFQKQIEGQRKPKVPPPVPPKNISLQGYLKKKAYAEQNPAPVRSTLSEDSPSPLYSCPSSVQQPKRIATVKPTSSLKSSSYRSFADDYLQQQYGIQASNDKTNVKVEPPVIEDKPAKDINGTSIEHQEYIKSTSTDEELTSNDNVDKSLEESVASFEEQLSSMENNTNVASTENKSNQLDTSMSQEEMKQDSQDEKVSSIETTQVEVTS